ncbi:hypothetical protein [Rhodococcus sp. X156]|uniref:hypothetical protein n=1 Tax=Rhodococcus sp. X156 TaxID=2499145 RepID=UPI000FD7BA04|nr:hypothetical protein [Rhodococcus sp. X156]
MLTAVVLVPVPPLLVPELAGGAAAETDDLRTACLRATRVLTDLASPWTSVGVHDTSCRLGPPTTGSWHGYGADVTVALGAGTETSSTELPGDLPLPALVAGWLRGQVAAEASVDVRLTAADASPQECAEQGRALAAELAQDPRPQGLLVLGDGCTTLTEKAPGALDERAAALQAELDHALATADCGALAALDAQLCAELGASGRVPWQVAAAAAAAAGDGWRTETLYRGAPYGVGYQVATWQR